jgi:uncharacterized protein
MNSSSERFSGYSDIVTSIDEVRSVIGEPRAPIVAKVIDHISDICRAFIETSPFALIASSNASGQCDVSPRGDPTGFVHVLDEKHLAIPDRPGNRLAATFTNLVENPHLALIFMIPGKLETLRVSGEARIVRDEAIRNSTAINGKVPEFAIVVYVEHAQIHCPKCMIRSKLWQPDAWPDSSGIASISEATYQHAKPPDMTLKELDDFAVRDGWTKLY